MGKDCGRSNERLDAKALAVYHITDGEGGGSENFSRLFGLRISFEMLRIQENRSLNKETLHMVIHHFIMHLAFHKKGLLNPRILEFRGTNIK